MIIPLIDAASVEFIASASALITALSTGHVALDMDVFPQDNSRTRKEAVSYTDKGYDGYAPIAAYVGNEGWCSAMSCPAASMPRRVRLYAERVQFRVRNWISRLDGAHDVARQNAGNWRRPPKPIIWIMERRHEDPGTVAGQGHAARGAVEQAQCKPVRLEFLMLS